MARSKSPRPAARNAGRRKQGSGKGSKPARAAARMPRKAAARRPTRKAATKRGAPARKAPARKARRSPTHKPAVTARRAPARPPARKTRARKAQARKAQARKAPARKAHAPKAPASKPRAPRAAARPNATKSIRKVTAARPKTPTARTLPPPAAAVVPVPRRPRRLAPKAPARRPALDRERRRLPEAELLPSPPSTLDFEDRPSAARSGHIEILEQLAEHTETGPNLTGGDVDADWEQAYSSGDEAPGGDNPTPDQDIVDEIGRSLGLEYDDDEELKGAGKIEERDRHRWELDPASSEDFEDR
jgi:hypothetical protein